MSTIANRRPMSAVHERNLVRRVKRGCEASARELIEHHYGFIWNVARYYSRVLGYEFDDAFQQASIGFMRGVKKFDTGRGTRLLTYAGDWVRQECKRGLENTVGDIRIPVGQQQKMKNRDGKFTPIRADRLDAPLAGYPDITLGDSVAGNDVSPEDGAASALRQARMKAAYMALIGVLSPLELEIAIGRLSRDTKDRVTLQAIGDRFSLSRERIRQVERDVITKLRLGAVKLGGRKLMAA